MTGGSILVTGATGRIGARVLRTGDAGLVGVSRAELDVTDRDSWRAVLDALRPSAVVHLAGVIGSAAERDDEQTRAANVEPLALLIEEGARVGVARVVLASSAAVYGDRRARALKESDSPDPASLYGRSKLAAEQLLARAVESGELETGLALRIFNVTGPGMHDSLIARLLRSTEDEPVTLRGDDGFVRDYVHVDDVALAILSAAAASVPPGSHLLNVARGVPVSNRIAVREVERARGTAPLTVQGEPLASTSWADVSAAARVLGFRARLPIVEGQNPPVESSG